MSIVLQSSGGGSVTLNEPTTASNFTATMPAATGEVMVSGNMPAFSAYASATQSVTTNVITKVAIDTENFDTSSNFDTTNYRFTPTVAGYYQVNATFRFGGTTSTITVSQAFFYKNGSLYQRFAGGNVNTTAYSGANQFSGSALIYFNGTTDYIELWGQVAGTSPVFNSFADAATTSQFSACLVRAA
jgi:hypothetical protein